MSSGSYLELFSSTDWGHISKLIEKATRSDVERALLNSRGSDLSDFAALVSPVASEYYLNEMAKLSHDLTVQRFGSSIRLFAPMYLSNECNNICDYCGFSLGNKIKRKTLTDDEIIEEAKILKNEGFSHVLLVTGESSKNINCSYFSKALRILRPYFSNLSMEVQPLDAVEYKKLIKDGLHGIFVYQETYNTESYAKHHLKGRKKNFNWRLETPERLGSVGINKIGLGCLYGLTKDWRTDAYFAAQHLGFLEKKFWRTSFSMSFPRLRPCMGESKSIFPLLDRDLVQLICAFRIFSHELEISISTRESPSLRENLLPLGVTTMSAGSKTNPGGYGASESSQSLEQFEVSDDRSPTEIEKLLRSKGYDPVWKDWDSSYDKFSMNYNLTELDTAGVS